MMRREGGKDRPKKVTQTERRMEKVASGIEPQARCADPPPPPPSPESLAKRLGVPWQPPDDPGNHSDKTGTKSI